MTKQKPILAGVIGNPVTHSLSPLIHTLWANRGGINGYYVPVEAPNSYDDFVAVINSLQTIGFAGVNVTLPHKENAFRYAEEKSENAQLARAANMLTFTTEGTRADNSDIVGFSSALKAQLHTNETPNDALVLGAGGAARGVILALKEVGCTQIVISNRTHAKAETLAGEFSLDDVIDWKKKESVLSNTDIIVNTTSLGMTGQPLLEIDISDLKQSAIVSDIVYNPLQTPLLQTASRAGLRVVDGLSMLMHQAVPGFRQWFNGEAIVDSELRNALIAELNRRGSQ